MDNKLYCGAGKERITPPDELIPKMFGLARSSFSGVHDDLYVRVIALTAQDKRMLIVSVDLDKAPCSDEFTEILEKETGVPKENMLYFGIHAHSVPITGYRPFEKRNDITKKDKAVQEAVKTYEKLILDQMIKAAKAAVKSQKPAKYGYGYGKSYINMKRTYEYKNRRKNNTCFVGLGWKNDDSVDRTAFVMRFESLEGKPIAFIMNYAMHNVAMFLNDRGDGKSAISSDVGGNVSKYMEAEFEGSVAIWSSGAAGDINCISVNGLQHPDPVTGEYQEDSLLDVKAATIFMKHLAAIHFQDILDINNEIHELSGNVDLSCATEYSKTPVSFDVAEACGYKEDTYNIRLRLARIGEVAFIGVNGELYSKLGAAIREASPLRNTVLITHESSLVLDNPGYIFDDDTILAIRKGDGCGLPGWTEFIGVPFTIKPSLQKCTRRLFEKQK